MIQQPATDNQKSTKTSFFSPWLEALALFFWGVLLLRYWSTGQIKLLIHPNYFWLTLITGVTLMVIGSLKTFPLVLAILHGRWRQRQTSNEHLTLLPRALASLLMLVVAIIGLSISPKVLASDTALQRGISETLAFTRSQPQSFRAALKPEDRSLIDWIRTINAYPEPDAYKDQKVNVTGFVVHSATLPKKYLLLSRFILTCCAVDAYPVGIPLQLKSASARDSYPVDTWLEVTGNMTTEELEDKRQLVIVPDQIKKIPVPDDPYDY